MAKSEVFKIIIKQNTYDILTADTNFYTYMDDSRLYNTFEKLIYEADKPMFYEYAEVHQEGSFILRMLAVDGSIIPCYATMKRGNAPGILQISLIDIAQWIASEKESGIEYMIHTKLLELYGDDFFIYNPEREEIKLITKYNVNPENNCISIKKFEELLKNGANKDAYNSISEFIIAIQKGNRYFDLCVNGNILNESPDIKYTLLRGTSIYEDGIRIATVGYIHRNEEAVYENLRKAELDPLTGLLSKAEITNLAIRLIDVEKHPNVSIGIVDIDYFKKVNDTFGHLVGDETLKKVTSIMEKEIGDAGVIGRIGGDEFFILFYDTYNLENCRERLRSIKNTVSASFPADNTDGPTITLSIGCAAYPKDADNFNNLFALADFAVYRAKQKGRNRYIIYDKDKHGTLEEIQKSTKLASRINSRGNMSYGDIICLLMDRVYSKEVYPMEKLLDDFIENFEPQRITIYDARKAKILYMVGAQVPTSEIIEETQGYIHGNFWSKQATGTETVINNISIVEGKDKKIYELMRKQGIISCIHIKFIDKNGAPCLLSLESVTNKITWNNDHIHYYRLMGQMLSQYQIV